MLEKSFVMLKPDAVRRRLVGQIIARFENADLKLRAMKLMIPSRELVEKHYPATLELLKRLGDNTLRGFAEIGRDPKKDYGTNDSTEIGKLVRGWLIDYICSSEVLPMVWEGNHAVKVIRKLIGSTIPTDAAPGTIRGDFSIDSPDMANTAGRAIANLVHASGNFEEAKFEIGLWFPELKD